MFKPSLWQCVEKGLVEAGSRETSCAPAVVQARGDESFHQAQMGVNDWIGDTLETELTWFANVFTVGVRKREESCVSDFSNRVKSCCLFRLGWDEYQDFCSVLSCLAGLIENLSGWGHIHLRPQGASINNVSQALSRTRSKITRHTKKQDNMSKN